MADGDLENPRDVELSSLTAIYPEIQQPKPDDPYTIALDLPVTPSKAVVVFFPAASDDAAPPDVNNGAGAANNAGPAAPQQPGGPVDSHEIAHLPSIHLEISFGPKYPADEPPHVTISANPPWLPADTVKRLEEDGPRLWEEMGRDMVGFTYIDHLQQATEEVFGLVGDKNALEVDPRHKIAILDYDIQARKAAFGRETFECGVCLDPKKGTACHRMLDCGHVFCVECLQDFYNNAIKEGDLAAVRCPAPNCAKDREKAAKGKKKKKPKTFISPSELLQIPLDQETVKRYVALKYKTELESDKNTVYCPRPWCNGAARSKKHKKPQGLELAEASDDSGSEDDQDEDGEKAEGESKSKPYQAAAELLSICEECSFAFCSRCLQSWHGEFFRCTPRRDKEELTAEELASLEYMKLHTTPCPTCAAPAQKTHGCNHMICYRCQSHFCYLCSAWLDPGNPYQHFNEMPDGRVTACYMRLWELELGDGNDVGYGFAGGPGQGAAPRPAARAAAPVVADLIPEIEEPSDDEEDMGGQPAAGGQAQDVQVHGGQVGIAREGPLVLRIAANQPAGAGRGGPRGRAAAAPGPAAPGRGGRGQQAGRGGGQAQGGGGGGEGRGGARRGGGGRHARAGAAAAGHQRGGVGGGGGRAPGGGGGVGGALPHHRQNNNNQQGGNQAQQQQQQQQHVQRRNVNNNPNQNGGVPGGVGGRRGRGGVVVDADDVEFGELVHDLEQELHGGDGNGHELDPAHEAWVRHFVQLALNDEEDILFEDDLDFDDWN